MPRYNIRPESFVPPNSFSPYLRVSFRLPFESRDPIYPASGLQLSFARSSDDQEIFVERMTARDVQQGGAGLCTVVLGKEDVPRYAIRRRQPGRVGEGEGEGEGGEKEQDEDEEVLVRLHAWKGEKHLGAWEVGRLSGECAFRFVD